MEDLPLSHPQSLSSPLLFSFLLTYLSPAQQFQCIPFHWINALAVVSGSSMKIFDWMHRRLLCFSNYSHFSANKELGEREEAAPVTAAETEALLLHDMLNGILAIGTVGRHHPLNSRCHSTSSETECYSFGDDEAEDSTDDHSRGRDKEAAAAAAAAPVVFKIKLSMEEETRRMEIVKVCELEHREAEEVPELPLLKRDQRRRTTLADLLAVKAATATPAE